MSRKPKALEKDWVSLRRLALILDEPFSKVRRKRDANKITTLKFGGCDYVHLKEAERLLTEKTRGEIPSSLARDPRDRKVKTDG